jgi:hypothetical protein
MRRTQPTVATIVYLLVALAFSAVSVSGQTPLHVVQVYDSDEVQLSKVEDIALSPPDEILVVDRDHRRIVVFGDDGRFRRELGRSGEGPGEFTGLWSAGGDESVVWGADVDLSRFVVFDSAGRDTRTIRTAPLESGSPARVLPVARLSNDSFLVAAETVIQSGEVVLLSIKSTDGERSIQDTLGRISVSDRNLVVPLAGGDGEAMLTHRFARSSYFAVSSSGDHIALLEQPAPADGEGQISIRVYDPEGEEQWSSVQRYELRAVTDEDVSRWLDSLDELTQALVERGPYSNAEAVRDDIREALDPVQWWAGVPVTGRGLLSRSFFVGTDGAVWLLRSPNWAEREEWLVVRATNAGEKVRARSVTVPPGVDLFEARGNRAWGVRTGAYGVPAIVELQIGSSDDAEAG